MAGCTKTVKQADVEAKIAGNLRKQLPGRMVSVSCPGGQEAKQGVRFTCTAEIDGRPAAIDVTLRDDKGTFSFRVQSPAPAAGG